MQSRGSVGLAFGFASLAFAVGMAVGSSGATEGERVSVPAPAVGPRAGGEGEAVEGAAAVGESEARGLAARAVPVAPERDPEARYADDALGLARFVDAEALDRAESCAPGTTRALSVSILVRAGLAERALELLRERPVNDGDPYLEAARALEAEGRGALAVEGYAAAARREGARRRGLHRLAGIEPALALQLVEEEAHGDPRALLRDDELRAAKARALFALGRVAEAAALAPELDELERGPRGCTAWDVVEDAWAWELRGRVEPAATESALRTVLAGSREHRGFALERLVALLEERRRGGEARELALEELRRGFDPLVARAALRLERGAAEAVLGARLASGKASAEEAEALARSLAESGRAHAARELRREWIESHWDDSDGVAALALAEEALTPLLDRRLRELAAGACELEHDEAAAALADLGHALCYAGDGERARAAFESALRLEPANRRARGGLRSMELGPDPYDE